MITVKLNGREVKAEKGETIIELARREGVYIPTLCYHPAVEPYSVCRVCMVEVFDGRRKRLVTACSYPIMQEGLEIETDTERVRRNRQLVLELLLARCPNSEALREFARRHGVTSTRFATQNPEELCILCGLCERVCAEQVKIGVISRAYRGIYRKITTPFEQPPSECIGCAACAFVCPTGAIQASPIGNYLTLAPWGAEVELMPCSVCGKPFAPKAQIERLSKQLGIQPEYLSVCFDCRKEGHALEVGRILGAINQRRAEKPA